MALRVCQLITELDPGGAERIVFELARGLDPGRFSTLVVSLRPATGEVADWLRDHDVPVRSVEMRSKLDLGARGRLAAILREERIELLHTHLIHAAYLGRRAARKTDVRAIVSTVHGLEKKSRPWRYWADRLTSHRLDIAICVSESMKNLVARHMKTPEDKLRVIYNGVDVERFSAPVDAEATRRSLGIEGTGPLLVSLGRLRHEKGHDLAIAAMPVILEKTPEARLVVVGDGPERSALEGQVASMGMTDSVVMAGQRGDVPDILRSADCLIAASRREGFGLAVAEAMAAELPVVGTDVGALPELIHDGESGVLVDEPDSGKIAQAVNGLLEDSDLRDRIGSTARRRVSEKFSLQSMLKAHEELYLALASSKGLARGAHE